MNNICFQYCPKCSSDSLTSTSIKSFTCSKCGFVFYLNVAAAVAALITDDSGKLLVSVRNYEPAKDTWDLPGGFVDANETIEECLSREIMEEFSINLDEIKYFCSFPNTYKYGGVTYSTIDLAFICKVKNFNKVKLSDEIKSHLILDTNEIEIDKFGLDSIKKIVSLYLKRGS